MFPGISKRNCFYLLKSRLFIEAQNHLFLGKPHSRICPFKIKSLQSLVTDGFWATCLCVVISDPLGR